MVLFWLRIIWSYVEQTSRAWFCFGYALFGHTYSRHHGRGFVLVTHYLVILTADTTMCLFWLRDTVTRGKLEIGAMCDYWQ